MRTTTTKTHTARFYSDILGLPTPDVTGEGDAGPHHVTISVSPSDLPRLRWRLLAAGAPVQEESPTSLSFRDPEGVRVELIAEPA
jgi:catechol 2,3-dioxygenase-like lactoylglutathione lyase family enzyme